MALTGPPLLRLSADLLGLVLLHLPKAEMARLARVCKAMPRLLSAVPPLACRLPGPYRPLSFVPGPTTELQGVPARGNFWEMNLLAVTRDQTWLFVAKLGRLYAFRLPLSPNPKPEQVIVVDPRGQINQIATGFLGEVEVVIVVTHQTRIAVLRAKDLAARPLLTYLNQDSTWSIACHAGEGRLAVGSNAHNIVTFRLRPQLVGRPQVLRGHRHNVPCLCYSPCGRFLTSTSIDGTVRLWDVETKENFVLHPSHEVGTTFTVNRAGNVRHWGWALAWLPRDDVPVLSSAPPLPARSVCRQTLLQLWDRLTAGLATLRAALATQRPPTSGLPPAAGRLLAAHYLLHCRSHHLLLLRSGVCGMETVAMVDVLQDLPPAAQQAALPCRLALMSVMPEWAAVAVSTQGNGLVLLYRAVQTRAGAFLFVLQQRLEPFPNSAEPSLLGMACVRDLRHRDPRYTLYVAGQDMQVRQYKVTLEEAAGLSAKAAEAPAVAPEALGAPGASASHPELPPTAIDISAGFTERVEDDHPSTDDTASMYTDDHEGVFGMDPGLELDLDEGLDFLDVDDDEDMPSLGVYDPDFFDDFGEDFQEF